MLVQISTDSVILMITFQRASFNNINTTSTYNSVLNATHTHNISQSATSILVTSLECSFEGTGSVTAAADLWTEEPTGHTETWGRG